MPRTANDAPLQVLRGDLRLDHQSRHGARPRQKAVGHSGSRDLGNANRFEPLPQLRQGHAQPKVEFDSGIEVRVLLEEDAQLLDAAGLGKCSCLPGSHQFGAQRVDETRSFHLRDLEKVSNVLHEHGAPDQRVATASEIGQQPVRAAAEVSTSEANRKFREAEAHKGQNGQARFGRSRIVGSRVRGALVPRERELADAASYRIVVLPRHFGGGATKRGQELGIVQGRGEPEGVFVARCGLDPLPCGERLSGGLRWRGHARRSEIREPEPSCDGSEQLLCGWNELRCHDGSMRMFRLSVGGCLGPKNRSLRTSPRSAWRP